tara:strand:- start:185 stop:1189 length:1005 start_codon:yes stop_codon:yes gene_type:complete
MLGRILKKIWSNFIVYILTFEILFQLLFFFNFDFIRQPILFYNGYCDQEYWNLYNKKTNISDDISYHPILTYKKNELAVPENFPNNAKIDKKKFNKNKISLYGSSYINHNDLKDILNDNDDVEFTNYALDSYGLDQIYLSYKLTAHLNQNRVIAFGFLLEDLDRSIFYFRDYQKAKFVLKNGKFYLDNVPVNLNLETKRQYDFYLYRFLKNFYNLLTNDFDPRYSKCLISHKKDLFDYFLKNIEKDSEKFNQKIIFITFNSKEDLAKNTNWRYKYMKDYFVKNSITHVDSLKIMKTKLSKENENLEDYFGPDNHNSKKSFQYIYDEFIKVYKAM